MVHRIAGEEERVGPRTILVDGYNVIRNTPGLAAAEQVSLQAGRDALLSSLAARFRHTPHRVIVVFDGNGSAETVQPLRRSTRGQVIFTRYGETADAVIQRIASNEAAAGTEVVSVSDDLEVRLGVSASGGQTASVDDLARRLNEPGKYQLRQARHRSFLKRQWDLASGEEPMSPSPRTGRRQQNRRRTPPL